MDEIENEEVIEEPQIDAMEANIEDKFNEDPLSDVFDNELNLDKEDEPEDPEPKVEAPEKEEPEPKKEDEPEQPAKETPEEMMAKIEGLNQTLAAERQRKREVQEENYRLRNSNQQVKQDPEKKGFDWTDPEKTLDTVRSDMRQEMDMRLLNLSESQCRSRHDDYSEKATVFEDMARQNPALLNQMLQQPDPAEWAYQQAANKATMQDFGNDPAAFKEKMYAEFRERMQAEAEADKNNKIKQKIENVTLPPSASKIKGKAAEQSTIIIPDDPLNEVFGDR